MPMLSYLVSYGTGEYDSYAYTPVRGFASFERAHAFANEMNTWLHANGAHRDQEGSTVLDFDATRQEAIKRLREVLGVTWVSIDYTGGNFWVDQEPIPVVTEP